MVRRAVVKCGLAGLGGGVVRGRRTTQRACVVIVPSLTSGMEMSSTNTVIILPTGGPKFLPPRFSRSASMASWKFLGTVADEKFTVLTSMLPPASDSKNMRAVEVLAVPGDPTMSTAFEFL